MRAMMVFWALALMPPAELQAQQVTTVILVRHAEQDYASDERDPVLSEAGKGRAEELMRVLGDVELDAIYSTPLHRTRDTAMPIARLLGLEVSETPYRQEFGQYMADLITENHVGQTVLVVSHSNTVPAILNALGGGPFEDLGHDEFDDLFVVTVAAGEVNVLRLKYGLATP